MCLRACLTHSDSDSEGIRYEGGSNWILTAGLNILQYPKNEEGDRFPRSSMYNSCHNRKISGDVRLEK